MKGAAEDEAPLDHGRLVGKTQRLDKIATSTNTVRQQETQAHGKALKGTRYARHNLRPKTQTQDARIPLNIDARTDANWASCETTRNSATRFVLHVFAATTHYGSNNSTSTSRVRTVCDWYCSVGELYISNFINKAVEARANIRVHTDSGAAKSISMREGTSKKESILSCETSSYNNCKNHHIAQSEVRGQLS